MSLTSNLLDWWSPFHQQQFSKCYPLLIHAQVSVFPQACPYSLELVLDEDWLPEESE